jgi:DnaJ-domain-containing protein 1
VQVAQASAPVHLSVKSGLSELYLGINYADTPGIKAVSADELPSRLRSLLPLVLELKTQLETTLQQNELPLPQLIKNLEIYASTIKQLLIIHAASNSLSSVDPRILSLSIPYGAVKKLLGVDQDSQNPEITKKALEHFGNGQSIYSFNYESLQVPELTDSDLLVLNFRPDTLRGYKVLQNASKEMKEQVYLKLAKYIAVNNLYTQLSKINALISYLDVPPLPRALSRELDELGDIQVQIDSYNKTIQNDSYNWAIIQQAEKSKFHVFNESLIEKYENSSGIKFNEKQKTDFYDSEQALILAALRIKLQSLPIPFADLSQNLKIKTLRNLVSKSAMIAFAQLLPPAEELKKQVYFVPNNYVGNDISYLERKIKKLIGDVVDPIPESYFSEWIKNAEKTPKTAYPNHKMEELTQDLYQQSLDITKVSVFADYGYLNQVAVNHHLARNAFQKEIADLHMRTSAHNLWNFVLSPETYAEAATQYKSALSKYSNLLKTSSDDQKKILNDDIEALNKAGKFFGFDIESKDGQAPTLAQLLEKGSIDKTQADNYVRAIKNKTLDNPILTITDDVTGKPLHEALALLPREKHSFAKAKVHTALKNLYGNIIKALNKIAYTKSVSELTAFFAQSSYLHQQFQKSLPTLASYEQTLTKAILDSMETRTQYEKYSSIVSQPMTWFLPLFMFPMLMLPLQSTLLTPAHPFIMGINRLHTSLSPHISGYMLAAMGLIVSDVGFQIKDRIDASQDLKDMTELYQTAMEPDHAFYDYTEISDAENKLKVSNYALASSVAMQAFFLGSFFLTTAIRESGVLLVDGWRTRQFNKVGFEDNNFKWNADEIANQAKTSRANISEDLSIHDSYKQLKIKEVDSAEKSLLASLKRQEARRDKIIEQFASQRASLGITDAKNPFNYELLMDAVRNARRQYANHQISEKQLFLAEEGFAEIITFMQTELAFSQPGPLRRLIHYSKRKIYPNLTEPSDSIIRQNLFQQVYGFNAVKKDYYKVLNVDKDHYATLGVDENAKSEVIKKAYRTLARRHHPDLNPNLSEANKKINEAKMREINEAYEVLDDPIKRSEYDALRRKVTDRAS